ncbi:hypothetical protein SPRG_02454 [Saprolegnia parasitica CBS 223.65]|uniref:Uncharacterized protein n=1 Tax=Saprolegnia parasitica (strain CBS 223.65) TaxID=695850 RepID=A0A067D1Z9_SAPPC|nr:hypothetical protein SPRG_02454 [Saprolegnia parasitica CBS 223.65]KDO32756.1 hypothetical protein SPRG_02454 [Saprolegnia parasitica CBS 223.65]|eukprot:XP_012196420.1 hypothetical protein SPRG_02454 [Saprolegnia parasitica CBS 223.65]
MTTELEAMAKEEERRRKKSAYAKAYYEANKASVSQKQKLRRQARIASCHAIKHEARPNPAQPTGHPRPRAIKTEWRGATTAARSTDAAYQALTWTTDARQDVLLFTETLPADLFVRENDEPQAPPVDEPAPTRCTSISNETTRDWLCVCPYCMQ